MAVLVVACGGGQGNQSPSTTVGASETTSRAAPSGGQEFYIEIEGERIDYTPTRCSVFPATTTVNIEADAVGQNRLATLTVDLIVAQLGTSLSRTTFTLSDAAGEPIYTNEHSENRREAVTLADDEMIGELNLIDETTGDQVTAKFHFICPD